MTQVTNPEQAKFCLELLGDETVLGAENGAG